MRSKMWLPVLVLVLPLLVARPAFAQGFEKGDLDVGPVIGVGGISGAGLSFGGRVEKGIKDLPSLGNGVLGVQGAFDYYSYDFEFSDSGISVIPISVMANYHLHLENRKLDPFVGLGLGYERVNFDCPFEGFGCEISGSGVYFTGHAGLRYYVSPKMAAYFDVGAGAATLNVGLMFKVGD